MLISTLITVCTLFPLSFTTDVVEIRKVVSKIQEINPKIEEDTALEIVRGVGAGSCEFGIEEALLLAVIHTESTFKPHVVGDGGKSWGLTQINYPVWKAFPESLKRSTDIGIQVVAGAYALNFWWNWAKNNSRRSKKGLYWINHYNSGVSWKAGKPWAAKVKRRYKMWKRLMSEDIVAEKKGDEEGTSG
ncbi:hypothetical protein LCGC14_0145070 [marine sediment metagenome]|uniref:Transglycosylase SLT domain-containing protein n=1 Tax=marine sediment metagenome TaxID=412755 RepID=A0A0F9UZP7_9ZZZZ